MRGLRAAGALAWAGLPSLGWGALAVLAFAPYKLFPLIYLSLAAIMVLWLRAPSPRVAAGRGFAFGLGFYGFGIGWIYTTVHEQALAPAPVALLCSVLLIAYLALFPLAVGWLQSRVGGGPRCRLLLLVPALWTLAELLRGWLFTGFPWLSFGVSQAPWSPLSGFAPLVGGHGLSWIVLLLAGCLAWAWHSRRLAPLLGAAALMLSGWGLQQLSWTRPHGEPVSVALVQGNIDQVSKWDMDKLVYTLQIHTELAEKSRARLILLPETAFPIFLDQVPPSYIERLRKRALANGGDVLLGVPLFTRDRRQYLNSVISLGTAPTQLYSKAHLVPFGEYIPLKWLFSWLYTYMHIPLVDFRAGSFEQKPLQVGGQRVAMTICYEDVFGSELRHPIPEATLMANVSNDAWFGNSRGTAQHLQIVQMRALESGRWWLRATNTGITAAVDESGHIIKQLPPFLPATLELQAQGRTGTTPYVRWGDVPLWLANGMLVVIVAWCRRRRA